MELIHWILFFTSEGKKMQDFMVSVWVNKLGNCFKFSIKLSFVPRIGDEFSVDYWEESTGIYSWCKQNNILCEHQKVVSVEYNRTFIYLGLEMQE